jgi:hypothetical protein
MQTSTQSLRATQSLRDYRFRFRRSCASRPHDFLRRTDRLLSGAVNTVLELTVSYLVQWPVEFFFPSVLPCPVACDNKIDLQIAPLADAERSAEARHKKFGVRELTLAFTAQRPPRARIRPFQPLKLHLELLIANLELEFLASRTKFSLLTFSNRKEIAFFHACPSSRRARRAIHPHISNRNSRFTEFRSTGCKHAPYQIPNRNKNAHFAFPDSMSTSHKSRTANREPRTTTRAAFRSTIPARPYGYR